MSIRTQKLAGASILLFWFGVLIILGAAMDLAGSGHKGPHVVYDASSGGVAFVLSILLAILASNCHIESVIARSNDSAVASDAQPDDSPAPTDTSSQ